MDGLNIFAFIGLYSSMTAFYVVSRFIIMNFIDLAQEKKDADRLEYINSQKRFQETRGQAKVK